MSKYPLQPFRQFARPAERRTMTAVDLVGSNAEPLVYHPTQPCREEQAERDVVARLQKLIAWSREIQAEASLKDKIRAAVNEGLEKRQREFYLRQQLAAIKKKLGDSDGDALSEYRQKIADTPFPDGVRKRG